MVVMRTVGIDLSVTSTVALSSLLRASVMSSDFRGGSSFVFAPPHRPGSVALRHGYESQSRLHFRRRYPAHHILLDVIGAVVISGTSLFGGKGKVKWRVYGALFIVSLDNSLNLVGLSYFLIMIVKGFIILTAAVVYRMQDQNLKTA